MPDALLPDPAAQVDDHDGPDDDRQPDHVCRFEQREQEQRIANVDGDAGVLSQFSDESICLFAPDVNVGCYWLRPATSFPRRGHKR